MKIFKKSLFLLLTVVVATVWASCSSSSDYDSATTESYEYSMEEAPAIDSIPSGELLDTTGSDSVSVEDERMIIKNAYLDMKTNDFDTSLDNIKREVERYGGEITESNIWKSGSDDYSRRNIDMVIRVPADNYSDLLNGVQNSATLESMNESSEDVTVQYIDITARIESLEAQEDRLVELLELAANVTEIMEIEYQLSNVRYERESYEQQRLYLERQVSLSTINLTLTEVETIIITDEGFFAGVAVSFIEGIDFLVSTLSYFITILAGMLPTLVFAGIILVIVMLILKATEPKRTARRLKKEEKMRAKTALMQQQMMQRQQMFQQQVPPPMPPQQPMQPPMNIVEKSNNKSDEKK